MQNWGWSWGDFIFNVLGSGFFVLQQYFYDELGGIQPKFSWHKSVILFKLLYVQQTISVCSCSNHGGIYFRELEDG